MCRHPKVGVLFSGGIDCTIVAALANQYIDENVPMDLLNVSFEKIRRAPNCTVAEDSKFDSPDRLTARTSAEELRRLFPNRYIFLNTPQMEIVL